MCFFVGNLGFFGFLEMVLVVVLIFGVYGTVGHFRVFLVLDLDSWTLFLLHIWFSWFVRRVHGVLFV